MQLGTLSVRASWDIETGKLECSAVAQGGVVSAERFGFEIRLSAESSNGVV